jgi:hypothetical protein
MLTPEEIDDETNFVAEGLPAGSGRAKKFPPVAANSLGRTRKSGYPPDHRNAPGSPARDQP